MPVEKSAGAIVFKREGGKTLFLLLHYPSAGRGAKKDYWDLAKGHIEKGEKTEDTVKREIKEETGLDDIKIIEGFKEIIKYFFRADGKNILKFVTFYLAETQQKNIKISDEHIGFAWLPYEQALEGLTFKNAKQVLGKANKFLMLVG